MVQSNKELEFIEPEDAALSLSIQVELLDDLLVIDPYERDLAVIRLGDQVLVAYRGEGPQDAVVHLDRMDLLEFPHFVDIDLSVRLPRAEPLLVQANQTLYSHPLLYFRMENQRFQINLGSKRIYNKVQSKWSGRWTRLQGTLCLSSKCRSVCRRAPRNA